MTDLSKTEINVEKKDYSNYRILIVSTSWNKEIIDVMQEDAISKLKGFNVNHIDTIEVPGAFELSQAAEKFIGSYDAVLALGTIIKGETYHFEIVANESSRALTDLSINFSIPIGNGILTVSDKNQAIKRSDPNQLNKGAGAALACLSLINIKNSIDYE